MSEDAYTAALKSSLTEIKKICPDINFSFIFTKDGTIVAGDSEADEETMKKTVHSFQSLVEKADAIGNMETLLIDGEKGKVHFSRVNDMYLALATSKGADITYLQSVTRVIFPTVLKLLKSIAPTPLQFVPSKQFIVDTLSGFFVGDSVQIDAETLRRWSELLNQKTVSEVEIEAFGGKVAQCKVKELNDPKLKGKGIIRIPEKICKTLEVEKGELVRVKPAGA
jgi:predicted regulator of Ras-like GTPase activity (Roadblock/LC7/MglB family)/DNA-binding Xre family transcriptional regulator